MSIFHGEKFLWYRVIAAPTERMATAYTFYGKPSSFNGPMFDYGFYGILTARRGKSACRREVGRDGSLIKSNNTD
jgi:hypothetical protein